MNASRTPVVHLDRLASLPALPMWWLDDTPSGALHNFASGWTFTGRIGSPGANGEPLTQLAADQFTGAAGSGDGYGDDDTPNLTLLLTNANAAALTAGIHQVDLIATRNSDSRVMRRHFMLAVAEIVPAV